MPSTKPSKIWQVSVAETGKMTVTLTNHTLVKSHQLQDRFVDLHDRQVTATEARVEANSRLGLNIRQTSQVSLASGVRFTYLPSPFEVDSTYAKKTGLR